MFITIGQAKLYATSFGPTSGPVILGIGGWIGSSELWAEPFSILSREWRTIAFDHRGAGATIAPTESITFDRMVDDVFAVLDAYSVEHCILAAESAGALTALGAALKDTKRITGLVIVDGLYYRETPPERDSFLLGLQEDYQATLDGFVQACVPEPDCDHIKRWGRQIIDRASQEAAIALYLAAGKVDLRSKIHHITQPSLVLHGELDVILPMQESHWLASELGNSKLTIIKGAGHVPTLTMPHQVALEISNFFANEQGEAVVK